MMTKIDLLLSIREEYQAYIQSINLLPYLATYKEACNRNLQHGLCKKLMMVSYEDGINNHEKDMVLDIILAIMELLETPEFGVSRFFYYTTIYNRTVVGKKNPTVTEYKEILQKRVELINILLQQEEGK